MGYPRVLFSNAPDHRKTEQNGSFCQPLENSTPLKNRTDSYHWNFEYVRYSSPPVHIIIFIQLVVTYLDE